MPIVYRWAGKPNQTKTEIDLKRKTIYIWFEKNEQQKKNEQMKKKNGWFYLFIYSFTGRFL